MLRLAEDAKGLDSSEVQFALNVAAKGTGQYWCMNCSQRVELDRHGRCSKCGSDAVVYG